ncbi:glycosyltransferase family 4 protein [Colwellia sp. BRX8-4]|uniref:glycosyltransferase family 4 protein n=1 Tax=Colwellia sp. BRX8-4 TaxID=2759836 RepID=UPI0015F67CE5|nr:glycosyltransferase family 4 protein [Colwellia sp. BRX8-4]MBA6364734.1 glycosyltransferase family 4 protein [Colwellia sp. BRX8-8]MBA6370484.1 glycosyltransferase family 4 protein [Colwellia sp. BRX8-4]
MKVIVFSANTSWYLYNFRRSTIQTFIDLGYKVVCFSPADDYSEKIKELGCIWQPLFMNNKSTNPLKDFMIVLQFIRLFSKYRPAYCFNFTVKNNIYGTWAAKLLRVKAINNVSGLGTAFIHNNMTSKIVKFLYKTSQPFASTVFCQNPDDYDTLLQHNLVPQDKLILLPGSGVDIDMFNPSLRKEKTEKFKFLFAGRILKDKGIIELIEAFNCISQRDFPCSLTLCGFASSDNISAIGEDKILEWERNSNIKWIGSSDDMPNVYALADCVVLPSYREGMPRSLLEAGAMGLPSITTDVPGCRNIIKNQYNGYICRVKDVTDLYNSMLTILKLTDDELLQLSVNSRKHVEQYYNESIVINEAVSAVNK